MNECVLLYWILTERIPGSKLQESPCTGIGRTKVGQNRKVWDRMKQISFSKPASAVHRDFEQTHVYLRLGLCLKITHYSLYCPLNRSYCHFAVGSECEVRIIKYGCFIVKKVTTAGHWTGNILSYYIVYCMHCSRGWNAEKNMTPYSLVFMFCFMMTDIWASSILVLK